MRFLKLYVMLFLLLVASMVDVDRYKYVLIILYLHPYNNRVVNFMIVNFQEALRSLSLSAKFSYEAIELY